MDVPEDRAYTAQHEWVQSTDGTAEVAVGAVVTVGITQVAVQQLGDLVFVQLPAVGAAVTAGQAQAEVESTKAVSDVYSPVTGRVAEVNPGVVDDPALVNADPYGKGWLFRVEVAQVPQLLSAEQYRTSAAG